jgi:hypothetical protein
VWKKHLSNTCGKIAFQINASNCFSLNPEKFHVFSSFIKFVFTR